MDFLEGEQQFTQSLRCPRPLIPDVDIGSLCYKIFQSNLLIVYQNQGHKLPKFLSNRRGQGRWSWGEAVNKAILLQTTDSRPSKQSQMRY